MWTIIKDKSWENILEQFSWVRDMEGIPQDPIFHAEGDVLVHTKMVIEALFALPEYQDLSIQEQEILFAAALLHDVEKRSTYVIEDGGRVSSRMHAKRGEVTARTILYKEIETPFQIREEIAKLVRYHGFPIWIFEKPNPEKALYRVSLEVNTELLYILSKADIIGRICTDGSNWLYNVDLYKEFCKEKGCFGKPKAFASDFGRYEYFKKEEASVDYVPFEKDCFEVILLSALPGTGKDTFVKKNFKDWPVVSLDSVRRKYKIKPTDKKGNGKVIQEVKEAARVYLRKKQSFIWNATNITFNLRNQLVDLFQTYGAKTKIIYLEVPFKTLLQQNRNRDYPVPESVIDKMIKSLEIPQVYEAPGLEKVV